MARKPATHAKLEKESSSIKGNHGGKREGAGRKKGVPNKVTVELGEAAREYTADCLEILVEIAHNGQSENARLQAVSQLLDRGHGRPKANVEINPEGAAAFSLTVSANSGTPPRAPCTHCLHRQWHGHARNERRGYRNRGQPTLKVRRIPIIARTAPLLLMFALPAVIPLRLVLKSWPLSSPPIQNALVLLPEAYRCADVEPS